MRIAMSCAASLAIFIGGVEYGRHTAASPGAVPELTADETGLPIAIQAAGSRYVATLAHLSDGARELAPGQREIAHEIALTMLYAAATELLRASGDDLLLETAADLVAARRTALRQADAGSEGRGGT